ncbi:MAG: 1-acyl-sn-glycerol-3-phosphate acyltransferase [Prevotellaceae bacterium]|jgi:1-acyl-sn-glycerol-3-phosphate acyltransferase|nr:1-acyl-sn-glycerol-3-phosphate acyltransferase [Prevotellaceae bacterium]
MKQRLWTEDQAVKYPSGRRGIIYRLFKLYVRLAHSVYYRKIYFIDKENMPEDAPLMVVSDHQNSLNDALALVLAINARGRRKIRAIARADAFEFPVFGTIFRGIGIMPAFRLMYQGISSLSNNGDTFLKTYHELLNNGTVIIYPEAGHQDRRWLGRFSYGYLRLAFEAAEKSNFEKEVFIMPSCNHYSDYMNIREDILIKFGEPVSLKPYYQMYREKHRTAQREVNETVRSRVAELMLNITDLDNYDAIDFLRNTYGIKYARSNGFNPGRLPEKLLADKQFFKHLDTLKTSGQNDEVQQVYDDAAFLNSNIRELKINDSSFDRQPSCIRIAGEILLFAALFLPYLFAIISTALVVYPPKLINRRIKDEMLHGTISLILSVLVTIPLLNIILFFSVWSISGSIPITLAYLVCLPFMFIFVISYDKVWKRFRERLRFYNLRKAGRLAELCGIRTRIHESLNKLLNLRKEYI